MEKKGIEEIFEKYRYESGTLDLAIEDQLPMIKEIQAELDRAREEGRESVEYGKDTPEQTEEWEGLETAVNIFKNRFGEIDEIGFKVGGQRFIIKRDSSKLTTK